MKRRYISIMSTPSFTELGQSIRKVLNSGYQYGRRVIKITLKTRSGQGLEIDSSYKLNCENPAAQGDAAVKLRLQDYGIFSEKLLSDGTINLEYKVDGKPLEGLVLIAGYSYNPSSSDGDLKITGKFKNNTINCSGSVSNILNAHLTFLAGAVVGLKGLFIGYQFEYESNSFTKSNIGITYKFPHLNLYLKCSPGLTDHYDLSAVYKVNDNFKAGVIGTLRRFENTVNWTGGCGLQYKLDRTSTLRMKLDGDWQLDTSIQQLLYDGVKVTLAFGVDLQDLANTNHRLGLGIDIEV